MMRSEREHSRDFRSSSSPPSKSKLAGFGSWISSIIVDPRQILAAVLTFTMFAMLAHMVKREHIDKLTHSSPGHSFQFNKLGGGQQTFGNNGPWTQNAAHLKPCWTKPTSDAPLSDDGYVTFSLTDGPEYHISQISDAVVVARNLGATLVLPDIRGSRLGDRRSFGQVYDVNKFIDSLQDVIRVAEDKPSGISTQNLAVVKVPNRVTENHIAVHVEPVFRTKGNIRVATYFPSLNMKRSTEADDDDDKEKKTDTHSVACLAMFASLELQPEVREVVDVMVDRLRTLSRRSNGRFVAIDLRVNMLAKKGCQGQGQLGAKSCYNAKEVAAFLRKLGFDEDTTVYITQSRWDSSLDALKDYFPKTYTKEGIMPAEKKEKFLDEEAPTLEEVIDFYICSESDVFVPAISGLFYANVAGKRIASGRTEILVPTDRFSAFSSSSPGDYISHYVTKRNHLAYSCFC